MIRIALSGLVLVGVACEGHGHREVAREGAPESGIDATDTAIPWWVWTAEQIGASLLAVQASLASRGRWRKPLRWSPTHERRVRGHENGEHRVRTSPRPGLRDSNGVGPSQHRSRHVRVLSASHDGQPYQVRIDCSASREREALVTAALGAGFSIVTRRGRSAFWVSEFASAGAKGGATEALARALGVADHETASSELLTAYERLASPFEHLMVWRGGGGGDQEAATLQGARRYDLLRSVLRGPNPEGRALAAVALKEAGAITPADRRTMETLAQSPLAVAVAVEDDMLGYEPSSKFFSHLRWPARGDFR